jgi:hypothetical protein
MSEQNGQPATGDLWSMQDGMIKIFVLERSEDDPAAHRVAMWVEGDILGVENISVQTLPTNLIAEGDRIVELSPEDEELIDVMRRADELADESDTHYDVDDLRQWMIDAVDERRSIDLLELTGEEIGELDDQPFPLVAAALAVNYVLTGPNGDLRLPRDSTFSIADFERAVGIAYLAYLRSVQSIAHRQ